MNDRLQKSLSHIEGLISIQKEHVIEANAAVDYLHGMLNGMILTHSIVADETPKFFRRPSRRKSNNVRHKVANPKVKPQRY